MLVLLPGSYGDGRSMVNQWAELAAAQGLMLVAPNARDRKAWQLRSDGPAFIQAVLDTAATLHALDRRRYAECARARRP